MLLDGRSVDAGSTIRTTLCIIGSGAAGITLALEFANKGVPVVLLESGALEEEAATQELKQARLTGTIAGGGHWPPILSPPDEHYFTASRYRMFGGTTSRWGGMCRPFDSIDFEERDWIPYSGWPITKADLDPYYRRAAQVCEVPVFDEAPYSNGTPARPALPTGDTNVRSRMVYFSPPTRFGVRYRDELVKADNVRVVINSNLIELEANPEASRVVRARVACLTRREFQIEAKYYVLATGGVENARLLLLSNKVQKQGLGNGNDLVGRFYMDHCYVSPAHKVALGGVGSHSFYQWQIENREVLGVLCLTHEAQRQERLHNDWIAGNYHMWHEQYLMPPEDEEVAAAMTAYAGAAGAEPDMVVVSCSPECTPNPASRVTLDDERVDALGCRRARVDWRINDADSDSIRRTTELIARGLGRLGVGRMRLIETEGPFPRAWGGTHHSGTTRMSRDPSKGVVNADCRMHQVQNLYMAGSSVFATLGASNPTFSIVALAIRLADHLHEVLSHER